MICPFRVGVKYEYQYIGANTKEERQKHENYITVAEHALFERCEEEECPWYSYNSCDRIGD